MESQLIRRGLWTSCLVVTLVLAPGVARGQTPWYLTGNDISAGDFLGTTGADDDLNIRVANARAFLIDATTGAPNIIGGWNQNGVAANVVGATIAGGGVNYSPNGVGDNYGTVCGGFNNTVGDYDGDATDEYAATVGGGEANLAEARYAVVAGGYGNAASARYSVVGGGQSNSATGTEAFVGGGRSNSATSSMAFVGGGLSNSATGFYSFVGGGYSNEATGTSSTVPGGFDCAANGNYSFAAGYKAVASNSGCFVWSDGSTSSALTCSTNNQAKLRTAGGVYWYTNSAMTNGVMLSAGSQTWSSISCTRDSKENIEDVDIAAVLEALEDVDVYTWRWRDEDPSIRHMGPFADDFYTAFGLGAGEGQLTTVDADGVALAAIKALHAENQELREAIRELREEVAEIRRLLPPRRR